MRKSLLTIFCLLTVLIGITGSGNVFAQVTTNASMTGYVRDSKGEGLPGATVVAIHQPSGSRYGTATQTDGRFNIPAMRVGGPYTVTASFVGYGEQAQQNITLNLGTAANVNFTMTEQSQELEAIEITTGRNDVFSSQRTGAATTVTRETINSLPTLSRNLNDFTRLTPQSNGQSFGGQDPRLNNVTIDGSVFNNSFGLGSGSQPGGRTGTSPISLDAIEEIQVVIAPYDVRQSGFVGAGVNAVTRSGTNEFSGSVFYNIQNQNFVGKEAKGRTVPVANFNNAQIGGRFGGPIIKNKLFFFVNAEFERRTEPFELRARPGADVEPGGAITSVLASDLMGVSSFMRQNFNYETGPYEGYDLELAGDKLLAKLDYNINDRHKMSVRYTSLDSRTDIPISNSSSLGFGNRRGPNSLSYQNSGYQQLEKIQSIVGELNSNFGNGRFSNNLIAGYTDQVEDRASRGSFFPLVEIQQGGNNYISFGFEPFTPSNRLSYKTYQLQDNVTYYAGKHTLTGGFSLERLSFVNVFFPGSQSVYVYNSLQDFYADANGYLANPNRTTSSVNLRRFQLRYSALPGGAEPIQPTRVTYTGLYAQDAFQVLPNLSLTGGVRVDVPFFDKTGYENPTVAGQTYYLPDGSPEKVSTAKLPNPRPLWSPRVGVNWDVLGDKTLQIRGGSGIFTGRPAFVWISNQIGNNGVLTGFEQRDNLNNTSATNINDRPFNPNPAQYIPQNAAAPSTFELALTDPKFKFPQIWRTNFAVDKQLPWGLVGTLEFIYNKNVNAVNYYDINREGPAGTFAGPDDRPRYPGLGLTGTPLNQAVQINDNTVNAVYLTNTNRGYSYLITAQLEKQLDRGFSGKVAYTFGEAKDLIQPGSIASGSWNGNRTVGGNNYPELAYGDNDQRHRVIGSLSYRKEYFNFGATQISLFYEARNQGRYTYAYAQDMNGDGVNGNDLLFIPNNVNEIIFLPITEGAGANQQTLFTADQQRAAFESLIAQDDYLSGRRGNYSERNGGLFPWIFRADLSLVQEFFVNVGGKRNTLQLRGDMFNIGNLLNSNWGVGNQLVQGAPLVAAGATADGVPQFRYATTGSGANRQLVRQETFQSTTNLTDVWRAQLGIRYIFN
jgi:hypothetical protein